MEPVDLNTVLWVKIFHLYKGGKRKISYIGDYTRISVRVIKPTSKVPKKKKLKSIIVLTSSNLRRKDGSFCKFYSNKCVLFKRKLNPYLKTVTYITHRSLRRKKFLYKFKQIL